MIDAMGGYERAATTPDDKATLVNNTFNSCGIPVNGSFSRPLRRSFTQSHNCCKCIKIGLFTQKHIASNIDTPQINYQLLLIY
jgi:hypothetical protein